MHAETDFLMRSQPKPFYEDRTMSEHDIKLTPCPYGHACVIAGHYHQRRAPMKGAQRRMFEAMQKANTKKEKKRPKTPPKWEFSKCYLCTHDIPHECDTKGKHAHDQDQQITSDETITRLQNSGVDRDTIEQIEWLSSISNPDYRTRDQADVEDLFSDINDDNSNCTHQDFALSHMAKRPVGGFEDEEEKVCEAAAKILEQPREKKQKESKGHSEPKSQTHPFESKIRTEPKSSEIRDGSDTLAPGSHKPLAEYTFWSIALSLPLELISTQESKTRDTSLESKTTVPDSKTRIPAQHLVDAKGSGSPASPSAGLHTAMVLANRHVKASVVHARNKTSPGPEPTDPGDAKQEDDEKIVTDLRSVNIFYRIDVPRPRTLGSTMRRLGHALASMILPVTQDYIINTGPDLHSPIIEIEDATRQTTRFAGYIISNTRRREVVNLANVFYSSCRIGIVDMKAVREVLRNEEIIDLDYLDKALRVKARVMDRATREIRPRLAHLNATVRGNTLSMIKNQLLFRAAHSRASDPNANLSLDFRSTERVSTTPLLVPSIA